MNATQRRSLKRREIFGKPRNGWGQLYNPYNTHYLGPKNVSFNRRLCENCKWLVGWGYSWTEQRWQYWIDRGARFQCPKCKHWQNIPLLPTIKTSRTHRNSGGKRQTKPMRMY